MKKLLCFLFWFGCYCCYGQIQHPGMLWLKGYSGNSNVLPRINKQVDGGFVVSVEATSSGGDIDSFCSFGGDRVIFFKYNADASNLEWTKCSTDGSYLYPHSDGSFVFGGATNAVPSGWAFKILKRDAAGALLWQKTYGGDSASARLVDMIATMDGGYIMVGLTNYSDTDFTVHYGSWMDDDIAVVRVDSNGNKVWSHVFGGSANDAVAAVVSAPQDGCYIVGTTLSNDHDFIGTHGGDDGYIIRLDKGGNTVWIDMIGGSGGDEADCAASDGKGGVLLGGASNSLDGDRTHFPTFGCPIWALEVDSDEHILWNNCYGGGGLNCYPNAICKSIDGSVWVAGVSTLIGGDVDTQYGRDDAWFVHTDDTGQLINSRVLGSSLDDRGTMAYPLSNSNVIAGGFYSWGDGTFPNMFTGVYGGSSNAFLTIFAPTSVAVQHLYLPKSSVDVYPNPASETVNLTSDKRMWYRCCISNAIGNIVYESTFIRALKIETRDWQPGLYLVKVTGEDGYSEMQKMFVLH